MEKQYNCKIYYPLKGFAYGLSILLIFVIILILISRLLNNPTIGVIGFILALTVPFFYQKKVKDIFTKEALLAFNEEKFSITSNNLKGGELKEVSYDWQNIKAYRFNFTPSKFTVLDIFLKKGGSQKIVFLDNKNEKQAINEESIFSIFRTFVKQFNESKNSEEKIIILPGFLTTTTGTVFIIFAAILVITAIVVRIKYSNYSNIGFLIIGVSIFIPLIVKRKMQKEFYNRISKLD